MSEMDELATAVKIFAAEINELNQNVPKLTEAINKLIDLISDSRKGYRTEANVPEGAITGIVKPHQEKPQVKPKPAPKPIKLSDLSELAQQHLVPHQSGGFAMKKYDPTGEIWRAINDELHAVAIAGGIPIQWIKAGKDSHWEFGETKEGGGS